MDIQAIKDKILKGDLSESELLEILKKITPPPIKKRSGNFLKTLLTGFIEGYSKPIIWKLILEAILIFVVIVSTVILSYFGKIDATVTAVVLAFVLGFLFGKIK
ncbi:MAG: hypothetical protein HYR91_11125 [Flavobacteriia bacterium]|nr:hypothetical protein [Flavobacteriia bacterium]